MFSGRISDAIARQIEKKITENNDLNALSNSELADLAVEFVETHHPQVFPERQLSRFSRNSLKLLSGGQL